MLRFPQGTIIHFRIADSDGKYVIYQGKICGVAWEVANAPFGIGYIIEASVKDYKYSHFVLPASEFTEIISTTVS